MMAYGLHISITAYLYKRAAGEMTVNRPEDGNEEWNHEMTSKKLNFSDVAKETHHVTQQVISINFELLHVTYTLHTLTYTVSHKKCKLYF